MSDQDDQEASRVLFGLIGAVVLGVLALIGGVVAWKGQAPQVTLVSEASDSNLAPIGDPVVSFPFAPGQAGMPDLSKRAADDIASALTTNSHAIVLVSVFQDGQLSPDTGMSLARLRATAVRNALVRSGVPAGRIQLRKPEFIASLSEPTGAGRAEVRIQ